MALAALTQSPYARRFAVLRNRDFALFFFSLLTTNSGRWMIIVVQGIWVFEQTGSKTALGGVGASRVIPLILFPVVGGVLADRFDRRKLMLFWQLFGLAVSLVIAFDIALGYGQVWHIYVAGFLIAIGNAFDQPARQAVIPQIVSREQIPAAVALSSIVFVGGSAFGPMLAAGLLLFPFVSIEVLFFLGAVGYAAIIWALLKMDIPPPAPPERREHPIANFMAGIKYAVASPVISALLLMAFAANLFGRSFQGIMPAVAEEILRVGESELSLLLSLMGFGALAGGFILAAVAESGGQTRLMLGGMLVFAVFTVGIALSPYLPLSSAFMFVIGVSSTFFSSSLRTTMQMETPGHMQGRVMSLWTVMFLGMGPLGGLFLGMAADWLGLSPALVIMTAIGLVIVSVVALTRPALRARL